MYLLLNLNDTQRYLQILLYQHLCTRPSSCIKQDMEEVVSLPHTVGIAGTLDAPLVQFSSLTTTDNFRGALYLI